VSGLLPGDSAPVQGLDALERGILWPVVYASVFDAPIKTAELRSRIVGASASESQMRRALEGRLKGLVRETGGRVWLASTESTEMALRWEMRAQATADLLSRHRAILSFVRRLAGVRFAALSGGCAHDSADDGDIDIFAVTDQGVLWRTLLVATLVSKARGWRRVLCLNYMVDETAMALPWRDFYAGFELISLRPLTDETGFEDLLRANPWVEPIFPNFLPSRARVQNPPHTKRPAASRASLLEVTARMIQRPYLRHRLPESPGVELSEHVVRLHTTDHRPRLRGLFQDALQKVGLEAPPWI